VVQLDLLTAGTTDVSASNCSRRRGLVVVADPDCPDLAVGDQLLQGPVGVDRQVERRRQRPVQDEQVDGVDAQLRRAPLEPVQGLVVPVITDPDLRLTKDLVRGGPGLADTEVRWVTESKSSGAVKVCPRAVTDAMRSIRKVRRLSRRWSRPTTYQRPRWKTTP
jgi:hypothetical protein